MTNFPAIPKFSKSIMNYAKKIAFFQHIEKLHRSLELECPKKKLSYQEERDLRVQRNKAFLKMLDIQDTLRDKENITTGKKKRKRMLFEGLCFLFVTGKNMSKAREKILKSKVVEKGLFLFGVC